MSARVLAAALLAAAALVYMGIARPLRAQALDLGDEYRQVRESRQAARQSAAQLKGKRSAPRAAGDVVGATRRVMLGCLAGSRVGGVRLAVRPGRSAGGAEVHVTAAGELDQVLELFDRLGDPRSGISLSRVVLAPRPAGGVSVEIDGVSS